MPRVRRRPTRTLSQTQDNPESLGLVVRNRKHQLGSTSTLGQAVPNKYDTEDYSSMTSLGYWSTTHLDWDLELATPMTMTYDVHD